MPCAPEGAPRNLRAPLRGEASLRGHLANPNDTAAKDKDKDAKDNKDTKDAAAKEGEKEESSGSSSYVAKEPEKDTQLQYALSFLRGTAKEPPAATNSQPAAPVDPAPAANNNTPNAEPEKKTAPN